MQKLSDNAKVAARQRVERKIALAAVDALLAAGYSLGVNDGEEITLALSKDRKAIAGALFTTDEDYLYIYEASRKASKDKRPDMWVRLVYGNDGWDVICDYSHASTLDKYLAEGSEVAKMIDHYSVRSY
jgi:hypothetical protein